MTDRSNINIFRASLIVEELIRNGADYFCVSPGSRSAPLTVAVARNAKAKYIICVDERAAAFHALGYARATGRPAVLICTSGSAVANYLPAVTEADADMIPMIILSADRPPELLKRGANQTTNQPEMFKAFTREQSNLNISDRDLPHEYILKEIDNLYSRSIGNHAGPVHVNCMFREPLAPVDDGSEIELSPKISLWEESSELFCSHPESIVAIGDEELQKIADILNNSKNALLIIGHLSREKDREAARELTYYLYYPFFADIRSGVRFYNTDYIRAKNCTYYDQILLSDGNPQPDTILHIGGNFVSKRINKFLENAAPKNYIHVDNHPLINDSGDLHTIKIESDIEVFRKRLVPRLRMNCLNDLVKSYAHKTGIIQKNINSLSENKNAEFLVARDIVTNIKTDIAIFSASSMPIRYFDMFAGMNSDNIDFAANRGVSGIDGTIASATGFASGLNKDTCLLIGDLAFIHDLNSLTLIKSIKQKIIIVLINNGGGGIFSHLPIAEHDDVFEEFFGTPHNYDFRGCVENFGIKYINAEIGSDFRDKFNEAQSGNESTVIEIKTDRTDSYKQLKNLQKRISKDLFYHNIGLPVLSKEELEQMDKELRSTPVPMIQRWHTDHSSYQKSDLNYGYYPNRKGKLLVFLHGFMGDLNEFSEIVDEFKEDHSILLIDLPGHGEKAAQGSDENYSIENASAAIISLIEKFSKSQCTLIGYSMGGRHALYIAMNYPEYINKLVLESASPGLKTEEERNTRIKHDAELIEKLRSQKYSEFLEDWYNQPLFKSLKAHKTFDILMKSRLNADASGLIKSLEFAGTGVQPSQWEAWKENRIPTLLICGEKDTKFTKIADEMTRLNKYSEKEIVEAAGHNVHAEKEEEFKKILMNYILR